MRHNRPSHDYPSRAGERNAASNDYQAIHPSPTHAYLVGYMLAARLAQHCLPYASAVECSRPPSIDGKSGSLAERVVEVRSRFKRGTRLVALLLDLGRRVCESRVCEDLRGALL